MADAHLKKKIYGVLKEGYFSDSPPYTFSLLNGDMELHRN